MCSITVKFQLQIFCILVSEKMTNQVFVLSEQYWTVDCCEDFVIFAESKYEVFQAENLQTDRIHGWLQPRNFPHFLKNFGFKFSKFEKNKT